MKDISSFMASQLVKKGFSLVLFREKSFRAVGALLVCSRSEKIEISMLSGNSFSQKHSLRGPQADILSRQKTSFLTGEGHERRNVFHGLCVRIPLLLRRNFTAHMALLTGSAKATGPKAIPASGSNRALFYCMTGTRFPVPPIL